MKNIICTVFLVLSFLSCKSKKQKRDLDTTKFSYQKTIIPKDTTRLWVEDGNIKSDTVLIICQGGPSRNLGFIDKGRTSYRYIPGYENYRIAYLHQAQTLNQDMFGYNGDLTHEMAEAEVNNSSEFLNRTLAYFKSRGKKTIVIGNSYGAYIIPNYLATREPLADKYVVIAGRINDNQQMLQQHLKGYNGQFEEDGITYIPEDENTDLNEYSESKIKEYRVKQLLKAAIGKPRYSEELAGKDLSNVTYFYAINDKNVGKLSDSELKFLKSKDVKIFKTNTGHSEALYRFIDKLKDGSLKL